MRLVFFFLVALQQTINLSFLQKRVYPWYFYVQSQQSPWVTALSEPTRTLQVNQARKYVSSYTARSARWLKSMSTVKMDKKT